MTSSQALDRTFKLFEFNVYNNKSQHQSSDEDEEWGGEHAYCHAITPHALYESLFHVLLV